MPPRGIDGCVEAELPTGVGGSVEDRSGGPCPRRTLIGTGDKYGGMADGVAVHGKQELNLFR